VQPAQAAPSAPAPSVGSPHSEDKDVQQFEEFGQGGGSNVVHVQNRVDARFLLRGRVDLTHVDGPNASPTNRAEALASCTDCQTFAVALQIALIRTDATTIAPDNEAVAVNVQCVRCFTSARAIQDVIQVDDPEQALPERHSQLAQALEGELRAIQQTPGITPAEANARIDAVVAQFEDLATSIRDQRQETEAENS
jgi:hypothetical protein